MGKNYKGAFILLFTMFFAAASGAVKNKGGFIIYPARITDETYKVYKVYENGETRMILQLSFNGQSEASSGGTTIPQASPDKEHIAYCDDGIIRIKNILTGENRKIAPLNNAGQFKIFINGWSLDGKKFLYHIMENIEGDEGDYDGSPRAKKPGTQHGKAAGTAKEGHASGYFIYDTASGGTVPVPIKGIYVGWGAGNNIICQYPSEGSRELISVDFSGNTISLFKYRGWGAGDLNQINTGSRADKAVAMAGSFGKNNGVIIADLVKNTSSDITGREDWGKIHSPDISMSGTKISWLDGYYNEKERAYIYNSFVVDKKVIFKTQDYIDEYKWISESAVIVVTRSDSDVNSTDELYVINPETGKILGMTPLE